jgi:5-bromo-4-chloroindolyl phosphate hydrolysis protein
MRKKRELRHEMASINQRAMDLVSTSVEDLRSSLNFYEAEKAEDVRIVEIGMQICDRRGEKTKAGLLKRKLNIMRKALETASQNLLRGKSCIDYERAIRELPVPNKEAVS